ncbi:XRE family transcriptional regulator [Nocardia carnea]|uniref:XRE family transcriptional regulator n=1 Tax=Nocardia carnea TaxID=37328 RepID=UPI0024553EEB|nr:helix-turn-helix transcriptional regulator [Nocardia carnea]
MTDDPHRSRPTPNLRVAASGPSVGTTTGTWFEPARLTRARVLAELDTAALAERVGLSTIAIRGFESGAARPDEAIAKLASILRVPANYFCNGRPLARIDRADIHFSCLRATSVTDRVKAAAHAEHLWELVYELDRRIKLPAPDLPAVDARATPAEAARELREHWGLPRGPVAHLGATMESHGIVLCEVPPADSTLRRVGTYSTWGTGRPLVVIPPIATSSVYDIRFSYALELAHLLLHPNPVPGDHSQEHEAHRFALEFLLPQAQIAPLLTGLRQPALIHLVEQWGVPLSSLLNRMDEADPDGSARRRRLSTTEPPEKLFHYPGETPGLLREAFALLGPNGHGELADKLHWAPAYVLQMLGEADSRPQLTLVP